CLRTYRGSCKGEALRCLEPNLPSMPWASGHDDRVVAGYGSAFGVTPLPVADERRAEDIRAVHDHEVSVRVVVVAYKAKPIDADQATFEQCATLRSRFVTSR